MRENSCLSQVKASGQPVLEAERDAGKSISCNLQFVHVAVSCQSAVTLSTVAVGYYLFNAVVSCYIANVSVSCYINNVAVSCYLVNVTVSCYLVNVSVNCYIDNVTVSCPIMSI